MLSTTGASLLLLMVVESACSCFTPECWLLTSFGHEKNCLFVEISGNNEVIRDIATKDTMDFPIVYLPQSGKYERHRPCQATVMVSKSGTKLLDIEKLTHGSGENLIMFRGNDHKEIDTRNGVENFFYIQQNLSHDLWNIHVFCPQLSRPGHWRTKIGIWNNKRQNIQCRVPLFSVCPSGLKGASIAAAYFQSPCRPFVNWYQKMIRN